MSAGCGTAQTSGEHGTATWRTQQLQLCACDPDTDSGTLDPDPEPEPDRRQTLRDGSFGHCLPLRNMPSKYVHSFLADRETDKRTVLVTHNIFNFIHQT